MGILSSMRDLAGGRVGTTGSDDRPAAPGAPVPATGSDAGIAHGQAPSRAIRAAAVRDRQVDELIGLVKGVLADGHVAEGEARFLLDWLTTNVDARDTWPASALYPRLARALSDDRLDADEESELLALLAQTVGGNAPARGEASMATALPLDDPPPEVVFAGRTYAFTGKFYAGTRDWCELQVTQRGGAIASVSKKLDYLVIGEIGSRDWIHSTHGRKIEKAVELRNGGARLAIVSERHWQARLA